MLQILFYLMAIITTVYSDCCKTANLCSDDDVNCHLKNYGIHCCTPYVKDNIALFASDSIKMLQSIKDLKDHGSRPAGIMNISNTTIELILQNFTSICKRYTKVMAIKHQLQYHMFKRTSLIPVLVHLETAAFRLQHIQMLHNGESCVEFTGQQYLSIYNSRYNLKSIKESLKNWINVTENCCGGWKNHH